MHEKRSRSMSGNSKGLAGLTALVTSGPTFEPIDPVRYIGNRSSGKQGFAIAAELARQGASVTVVTGPTTEPPPADCCVVRVETAQQLLDSCKAVGAVDIAVCVAAVADYRVDHAADRKIRKEDTGAVTLHLIQNPDTLKWVGWEMTPRPKLVVGFAGETEKVLERATAKRVSKGCDWILGNDVSPAAGAFGAEDNTIIFVSEAGPETWPRMSKVEIARKLVDRAAAHCNSLETQPV
ncbi:MAG: hypothetical protein IOD05_15540 [Rhodobacter sp.]|nr:hypothetical protein [Rhodobacter sp.]